MVCGWTSLANPKSISFTCKLFSSALRIIDINIQHWFRIADVWTTFVNTMLLGLMSKWRMSLECRYSKASTTFSLDNQQNFNSERNFHLLKEMEITDLADHYNTLGLSEVELWLGNGLQATNQFFRSKAIIWKKATNHLFRSIWKPGKGLFPQVSPSRYSSHGCLRNNPGNPPTIKQIRMKRIK